MNRYIRYILYVVAVIGLAGCADDAIVSEPVDGGEHVYTLQVTAEDPAASRVASEYDVAKVVWRYGDQLILSTTVENETTEYTFTLTPPQGSSYAVGDEWEPSAGAEHPRFSYSNTEAIPSFNSFTGKLKYKSVNSSVNKKTINSKTSYAQLTVANSVIDINVYDYHLQRDNDNTEHLRNIDKLSATLHGRNLATDQVIVLKREYSILKIKLDDFYYSIYKGSMIYVKGLGQKIHGVALTDRNMMTNIDELNYLLEDRLKGDTELKQHFGTICDLSDAPKDPDTGYAIRDDNPAHQIVAYVVIDGPCELNDGDRICVGLREHWSQDWYFWQTEPLRAATLPAGSVYTLDFTKKAGDRHLYHSTVAINTSQNFTTHLATTNIGARSVTDAGEYYMFGFDKPVVPGGFYPNYPSPTPFFHYTEKKNSQTNNTEYLLGFGNINETGTNGYIGGSWPFMDSQTFPTSYNNTQEVYIGSNTTSHKVKFMGKGPKFPSDWWREWISELADMPNIFHDWTPMSYRTKIGNSEYLHNSILMSTVIRDADNNPLAVKLVMKRTQHCIVIPVSGVLEPTEYTSLHIGAGATAQIKEGTENYALMGGLSFYMPKPEADGSGKAVQMVGYHFDASSEAADGGVPEVFLDHFGLYMAMPVRPMFYEGVNIKETLRNLLTD